MSRTLFRQFSLVALIVFGTSAMSAADSPVTPAAPGTWSVDYAHWPAGHPYGKAEAGRDWPTLQWFEEPGAGRIGEFPAGSGRHWLEVGLPAGTFGGGRHGVKFAANLAPRNTYTLEYDVHFPADWEFSQGNTRPYGGGKLPGLSGGSHPSGGNGKPDGMSARPMWRRDSRFSKETQNYLELYLYWRQQTEKYGDRFFAQTVEAGRTYRIKLRVDLGTPQTDGTVWMWIDGALRVERSFRFLAPNQNWKLTQYMHNVFYGGNDPTWAPARDQHLLLGPVHLDTHPF
ncbi:MAG TPA: hypothetical protein VFC28_11885 [Opitutaceae bacterium]|nr:hypothetical protein [Opitutaceae bacterium]